MASRTLILRGIYWGIYWGILGLYSYIYRIHQQKHCHPREQQETLPVWLSTGPTRGKSLSTLHTWHPQASAKKRNHTGKVVLQQDFCYWRKLRTSKRVRTGCANEGTVCANLHPAVAAMSSHGHLRFSKSPEKPEVRASWRVGFHPEGIRWLTR